MRIAQAKKHGRHVFMGYSFSFEITAREGTQKVITAGRCIERATLTGQLSDLPMVPYARMSQLTIRYATINVALIEIITNGSRLSISL